MITFGGYSDFCANFINQNSFCDIRENTLKSYGMGFCDFFTNGLLWSKRLHDDHDDITRHVRMLAKLGLRSMSFLERTRIEARFPESIFLIMMRIFPEDKFA